MPVSITSLIPQYYAAKNKKNLICIKRCQMMTLKINLLLQLLPEESALQFLSQEKKTLGVLLTGLEG